MRIELQPAYLLHSRKVSDSRLVADFITRDYGLVSAMARAPTKKQSPLALFRPIFISWLGDKELKTLTLYESAAVTMPALQGKSLFCGFYLNELLVRLLNKADGSASLYEAYQNTLLYLPGASSAEPLLRRFERMLLEEAGFAIDWYRDITGLKIMPSYLYRLKLNAGFERVNEQAQEGEHNGYILNNVQKNHLYTGADLLALAAHQYDSISAQLAAKKIMRQLLAQQLGAKPLKSRELFLS